MFRIFLCEGMDISLAFSRERPSRLRCFWPSFPWGKMAAGIDDDGRLRRLSFVPESGKAALLAAWARAWPQTALADAGEEGGWGAGISAVATGTDFQIKVWQSLMDVPSGQTATYSDLARKAGSPHAARAVGRALASNPLLFLIPCHRVLPQNGGIGGYAGGEENKRMLLEMERAGLRGR